MTAGNASQTVFIMLALPALFGMTLVGEGLYKISRLERGWVSIFLGCVFLSMVAAGYYLLKGLV